MTERELGEYIFLRQELEQLREKIEELGAAKTSIMPLKLGGPIGGSGGGNRTETLVLAYDAAVIRYQRKLKKTEKALEKTERALNRLPARERVIFRDRYISGLTWAEIALKRSYSEPMIYKIRRRGLAMLEKI